MRTITPLCIFAWWQQQINALPKRFLNYSDKWQLTYIIKSMVWCQEVCESSLLWTKVLTSSESWELNLRLIWHPVFAFVFAFAADCDKKGEVGLCAVWNRWIAWKVKTQNFTAAPSGAIAAHFSCILLIIIARQPMMSLQARWYVWICFEKKSRNVEKFMQAKFGSSIQVNLNL